MPPSKKGRFSTKRKTLKTILVTLILILTFILVYTPHLNYKYPSHIDEWRHITESQKLKEGEYKLGTHASLELGFHLFLRTLSYFTDIILAYKYLPALFASLSSLALFFFTYKTTKKYYMAVLSMIFFASLRSNTNIMGLWFFVPLTFAIPLIYLFFLLFSEGIEKNNTKKIICSLIIYTLIFFMHPVSATFMIPILIIYLIIKRNNIKQHYKLLLYSAISISLIIIAAFSKFLWKGTFQKSLKFIIDFIKFQYGWGVLELNINIVSIYTLTATIFAIIGFYFAIRKKHYLLTVWPTTLLLLILMFRLLKFTIFAPYQRIIYYLLLGLVPLSGIGLYYTILLIKNTLNKYINLSWKKHLTNTIIIVVVLIIATPLFKDYNNIREDIALYEVIDDNSYNAIKSIEKYPTAVALAPPHTSTAIYPISGHNIISTLYFYGSRNRKAVENAYSSGNCSALLSFAKQKNASFILNEFSMSDCNWQEIYNNGYYIYKIK